MTTGKPILDEWVAFATHHPELQQFGQSGDASTFDGATGCTHTVFQRLILGITGKRVTHDQISAACGYPNAAHNAARRGMIHASETDKVVRAYGLPYKYASRPAWDAILKASALGPVILPVLYGWYPEKRGCVYSGIHADGRPNGFALLGGKTQLSGFTGPHATLLLGYAKFTNGYRCFVNEPNHGSPARPEKPAYDEVTTTQLARAYAELGKVQTPWAYFPTRAVHPKG